MSLQTDDQTLADLRIFSTRDSQGIYELYNHTHTRGGQEILEEMFRNPLSDKAAINHRSGIISDFARMKLSFPLPGELFDIAEKYLLHAEKYNRKGTDQVMQSQKEIDSGVASVIELMQLIKQFIQEQEIAKITAYSDEREAIALLLDDPSFEPVWQKRSKKDLSYGAVTAYDLLFRSRETDKIETLMRHIYQLDVYITVAKVAVKKNFIFPTALEKGTGELRLRGVYHPDLQAPVRNDVFLNKHQNLIFLTGANMAGKSTFLRALSTAVYIAHMGFPVAAGLMEFSVLDGIYTTINLPDNLGIGASHFYAEVLRVKNMATELSKGKSLLVIFDELFRGTNVKDAHEGTVAICTAFSRNKKSLFIISSHIVEAGVELKEQPGIVFQYLPTIMKGHQAEYTYTLREGITDDRHGMMIIRNEGIMEILKNGRKPVATAPTLSEKFPQKSIES
jgi:DNA mismatch repair ATPase MutS